MACGRGWCIDAPCSRNGVRDYLVEEVSRITIKGAAKWAIMKKLMVALFIL
jgi:hypothetical protein